MAAVMRWGSDGLKGWRKVAHQGGYQVELWRL